jgi:phage gpG-like protein
MTVEMEVLNAETLRNELNNLEDRIKKEVYETLIAMSRVEIETVAKRAVPVDTGRLKSSIMTLTEKRKTYTYTDREGNSYDGKLKTEQAIGYEVLVGTNVEYAIKIHERGGGGAKSNRTVGGQKRPKGYGRYFLKNAYDQAIPKMIIAVRKIKGIE